MDEHFVEPERIEPSISDCDRILQSEPDNYKAWHIRGHLLAQIERYEESIASYDKALKIKVDDCDSWFERGYVLSDMNREPEAIASYDKAIEFGHPDPGVWYMRGNSLYRIGDINAALESYDKAIELGHNDAGVWYMRGKSLSDIGDIEAALESYEKATKLQPDSGEIWYAKGLALLDLKRYGAAVISFSRATQYAPDSAYAWYLYGATLEETGNLQKALDSLTKALELEENVFFLTDRGRVLRKLGQYDAAMASYDRALKLDPNYENIWLNRGALLCDYLNLPQEALACFKRAVEIAPDNPLAWYNQGNTLRHLERYQEAIASYEKAIQLEPDYHDALRERDWLSCLVEYKQQKNLSYDIALKLVNLTIETFLDGSTQDEDRIDKILTTRRIAETHREDLIVFIPLAFGRAYLSAKGTVMPPNFVWIHPETEQQYPVILSEQPIFQAAYDVAVKWMNEKGNDPEFMYLAQWSAEVKAIPQMLDDGSRLEDWKVESIGYSACKPIGPVPLKSDRPISQEVIRLDNWQPPKSAAEKPWWKLW